LLINEQTNSDESKSRPDSPDNDYIEPSEYSVFQNKPTLNETYKIQPSIPEDKSLDAIDEKSEETIKYKNSQKYISITKDVMTEKGGNIYNKDYKLTRNMSNQLAANILGKISFFFVRKLVIRRK